MAIKRATKTLKREPNVFHEVLDNTMNAHQVDSYYLNAVKHSQRIDASKMYSSPKRKQSSTIQRPIKKESIKQSPPIALPLENSYSMENQSRSSSPTFSEFLSNKQHELSKIVEVPSISESLLAQFDREVRQEMGIPLDDDDQDENNTSQQASPIPSETSETIKNPLDTALYSSEIDFLRHQNKSLEEKELGLTASIHRLQAEIKINEAMEQSIRSRYQSMWNNFQPILNSEIIPSPRLTEEEDEASNPGEAVKQATKYLRRLQQEIAKEDDACRRAQLSFVRQQIRHDHTMEFENAWSTEMKGTSEETRRLLLQKEDDLAATRKRAGYLQAKRQFYDDLDLESLLVHVIDMLKGRKELPNGEYLSCARALEMYSELKQLGHQGHLTIETLRGYLHKHQSLLGVLVPSFGS